MIFVGIAAAASLSNAFVSSYGAFCAIRFVTAMGHVGMFLVPFTTTVELVSAEWMSFWGNMAHVPFALGEALVVLIAYLIRDWKDFQIWSSAPVFLVMLIYFVTPESPRWLIAKGRYKEARAVIERAAKWGKVELPEHVFEVKGW